MQSTGQPISKADAQNDTPGQRLLGALVSTSAGRLERYSKTTAAVQSKAKQTIPAPKPPRSNVVGNTPEEEVQQLQADVPRVQGNMQGVLAMLHSKAQRHAAAWERYQASRQQSEQRHNAAAAASAASSKASLETINSQVEQQMSVLADDRVMVLDEVQLHQVWQSVEQQRSPITACIDALAAGLHLAEQAFSQEVQAALQGMVASMCDIAHLDEGRIQRLTEQETATLNLQLLANRRAASEVLQQLHADAVLQEQARYKHWQAACEAWRTLRSRHAVATFCQHITQDLSEPPERLQLFAQLRDSQQEAHSQLIKLCQRLRQLGPPHLNSQAVSGWVGEGKQWVSSWRQRLTDYLHNLQQQEHGFEEQVQAELTALRSEVLGYKGLSNSEVEELLTQEVHPVLQARQAAAQDLLQCATTYLERQAAEWQLAVELLSSWLSSLVGLFEQHKASTTAAESSIKAALRASVQQFTTEDAAREAALEAAVQLLSQGCDEKELDVRLEAALQALAAIQAGYRGHAAAAVATVRAYPRQVKDRNDMYIKLLCGMMHVLPPLQAAGTAVGAGSAPAPPASAIGSAVGSTAASTAPAVAAGMAGAAQAEQQEGQPVHGQVQLPTGSLYNQLHDLWQGLLEATPKPWLSQFSHMQPGSAPAQQQPAQPEPPGHSAVAPQAAALAPSVSVAGAKAPPAGKLTKQQQAEAAAAEEAARAAEAAAAAAAAAADAAAYAAAAAQPPCPMSSAAGALCMDLRTPDNTVSEGLLELQASMLLEAESFAGRVQGGAESWAEQMEVLLTEELDGCIRAHRPRAGRIEEEVRVVRSAELVAQRRRVDSHLKAQEKAVQQQAAQIDAAVLALQADAAAWRSKLLDYERLLGNALSSKGIDICWREAQALRVKLDKQLEQRMQELRRLVDETCSSVAATSTAFEAEHLKSFADGGKYAEASLTAHRANLVALHTYVSQQQTQQQAQLAALHTELTSSIQSAQDAIEALLPSHKQDMALVELLAQKVEGARKKAAAQLGANTQAAESIDQLLAELQGHLSKAAPAGSAAATSTGAGAVPGAAKAECQQLMGCVSKLQQQLLRQSQVLDMLQSSSVPAQSVEVTILSELQPLAAQQDSKGAAAGPASSPLPSARAATPQPAAKGNSQSGGKVAAKGGRTPSAAGGKAPHGSAAASNAAAAAAAAALAAAGGVGGPAAAEGPVVPLEKHITSIIGASKQEVEVAAKAYYAAKEAARPIRYPSRIAPTLPELMSNVDGVMNGLRQMLQEHMEAAVKHFRVQVVQAYRLLEPVPAAAVSLLTHHLLQLSADQRQQLLSGFLVQRQQLERQLEQHKHSLHPSMLSVARRAELEALKAAEAARQQAATALTSSCATAALGLTQSHAQQLTAAVADMSRLLLALLDGCVLPADLVPAPVGDDSLSTMQRLSLETLSNLAAAQDAAQPAGAASNGQAPKLAAASKAAKPGGDAAANTAAAGAAAAPGAGSASPTVAGSRPFVQVSWQLNHDGLALANLGWTAADQSTLVAAAPAPTPPATGTAVTPAPGHTKPAAVTAPKAAAAAPSNTASTAPPVAAQMTAPGPLAEPVVVCGLDTVCHRAVVLAHRAAVQQVQAHLAQASVAALKKDLYVWTTQEQQWACAWEAMLQDLDTV